MNGQPTYTDAMLAGFGFDPSDPDDTLCTTCGKAPCGCPSFVREDRSGKLHFDDAGDWSWQHHAAGRCMPDCEWCEAQLRVTQVIPVAEIHAARNAAE